MSRKFAALLVFSLLAGGSAAADTTPMVDESYTYLRLVALGSSGYEPNAYVSISHSRPGDSAKMVWKLNNKTIATTKCSDGSGGECRYSGPPLKVTGAMTAELLYWDDRAEKETVVRTFKFDVRKTGTASWQIVADDVLGAAWAKHLNDHRVYFYMWFTNAESSAKDFSGRCTVDGTPLPDDFGLFGRTLIDVRATDSTEKVRHYRKFEFSTPLIWGSPYDDEWRLTRRPGAWECRIRRDGKTVRELRFTVTPDGRIANDEIQSGKDPVPVVPDTVFIDNRLGKDASTFDERFDPVAYKKSLHYGLPWPDHPKVKSIHAAAPPKFGPSL
jgi:hypothetical protein